MRQESIKILEDNRGSNLFDLGCSNFLLDMSPKARETKAKMNYWDFTKIKSFGESGWLSGLVPPPAQGLILETQDQVPHEASCMDLLLPLPVSLPLSLNLGVFPMNK